MILIKAEHDRRVTIGGVAAPVRRPVDIDQARTGFTNLRTLRIYCFEKESVIEGHAEEDEVFLVVLAGSVELTVTEDPSMLDLPTNHLTKVTLSAPDGSEGVACAAYLPPGAAYKLIAKTDADVAYARATPSCAPAAKIFSCSTRVVAPGVSVLLEETAYAVRLRLRLVQVDARAHDVVYAKAVDSSAPCEALVHIRALAAERVAVVHRSEASLAWLDSLLDSWDTVAAAPSDDLTLHVGKGSSALVLIVMVT